MFTLPPGEPIETEIDIEVGSIQPFDFGVITTWVGRRKTPSGHRLIRAGRTVGWISEDIDTNEIHGGQKGRAALETLEAENKIRHTADQYSQRGLGLIAELLPCLLYTSPSPRDRTRSRMPSSA